MKLIVAGLLCAAASGVAYSVGTVKASARPAKESAFQLCLVGGVELVDERCDATGACAKQSVRLTWERGEGVLYEGDSTGEREQRRIRSAELDRLLADLSELERLGTDVDQRCEGGSWRPDVCAAAEQVLTITTTCGRGDHTFTFMRARPAWDRVRSDCGALDARALAKCTAERTWHAAFATHLAVRFGTVFQQLRKSARAD